MTKILGVDVRDATAVSSNMCCTFKVVPCRDTLCVSTSWSSSTTENLSLPISSTKKLTLNLSLLTVLLQSSLFILKQTSSYLLSFCPWCWWKKLPSNIHFSPWSLASLLSFTLTCTCWKSHWECLWSPMPAAQLWRYRGGRGAETFLVLLTLALCMPSSCETAWATVSPDVSGLDLGLVCPQ